MFKACAAVVAALAILGMSADLAQANRANGKAGQLAICKEKINAKHLSGDASKAEWKKCMADANAYQ
jgi:hypothetical protein